MLGANKEEKNRPHTTPIAANRNQKHPTLWLFDSNLLKFKSFGGPGGCLESKQNQSVTDRWDRRACKSVPMLFNVYVPPTAIGFEKCRGSDTTHNSVRRKGHAIATSSRGAFSAGSAARRGRTTNNNCRCDARQPLRPDGL